MVDYSKWKDIEISDDEDETHPNIDTPSLFRWRHQARIERMEERKKEKEALEEQKLAQKKEYDETKEKIRQVKDKGEDAIELENRLKQLEVKEKELKDKESEMQRKEKVTPWNVDTISSDGFTKTVVNKPAVRQQKELTDEEKEAIYKKFVKDNESLLKQFGMLRKYDDSKRFLLAHPELTCEETANYLVVWCINLEVEEKHNLMEHVAHQCICMQYILELSKVLDMDPRGCVSSFFIRIQMVDPQYKQDFEEELKNFKARIVRRAQDKLDAALKEVEEEEKQKRLGPGGLDPAEVYESLPKELQECFDKQDIPLLQETIAKMSPEDATYHMKRCVDSGLWVPDANKNVEQTTEDENYSEIGKK